jgi:arylsulfatase A-like enzyme
VSGPHVVLVVLDTVRADGAGLGAPGRSAMPALQAFAGEAAVYTDASSTSPWTLPSHASLFTGAWVWRHGCDERHRRLGGELPTLAERLADAGYATGAVSANAWVGPDFGLDRGFQQFVRAWQLVDRGGDLAGVRRSGRAAGATDLAEALRRARAGGLGATTVNTLHHLLWRRRGRLGGERVARRSVALARALRGGGRPVFLFVNFLDAHLPYWPPRRYRRAALGPRARGARRVNQDPWAFIAGRAPMGEEDLRLLRGLYTAELAHLDDVVRRLLEGVDATLGLDDTVVVVTSDHGEHLGEHGLMDHQYSLGEWLLQVPLAVRWPGSAHVGVHPGLRQLVDVAPTILAAAGRAMPAEPGLGSTLDAEPRPWALAEYLAPQPTMEAHARRGDPTPFRRFDRALRALRLADGRKVVAGSDGSVVLHDLAGDPEELHDLAAERPSEAAELAARLRRTGPGEPAEAPAPEEVPDGDVRRALESLGYLQ